MEKRPIIVMESNKKEYEELKFFIAVFFLYTAIPTHCREILILLKVIMCINVNVKYNVNTICLKKIDEKSYRCQEK